MPQVRPGHTSIWPLALTACLATPFCLHADDRSAARPSEAGTAAKIDAALARGLPSHVKLPALADDITFLRRVSLDLTGKVPEPDALRRFAADPAKDKRAKVVDELLKGEAYAVNWGRYWRDTVTYNSPASANYIRWKM